MVVWVAALSTPLVPLTTCRLNNERAAGRKMIEAAKAWYGGRHVMSLSSNQYIAK